MKRKQSYKFQNGKKQRNTFRIIIIVIGALFSVSAITWIWWNDWNVERSYERLEGVFVSEEDPEQGEGVENPLADEEEKDGELTEGLVEVPDPEDQELEPKKEEKVSPEEATRYIEGQKLPSEPTYVDGILIANKRNPLPSTFEPGESREARDAFEEMAAAAVLEDIQLTAFSTYRSFDYQTGLYDRYVERDGVKEADRYSARPGYSEHQTGLAFDIGEVNREEHWASASFGDTAAGKWLVRHAHLYGFILRYPEGKEPITGYMYEAWHFRYVGKEIAKDIYENDLTLEEYLDI